MNNRSNIDKNRKCGAALIIVLGFLALLTLMMITYSAFIRTERRAGNAYLSTAQTRHLLHTALSRAMEDLDHETANQRYPEFLALASPEGTPLDSALRESLNFKMEQAYIPMGNAALSNAYSQAFSHAKWQTVTSKGVPFGRVGYLVVNTSGLLDANSVGGQTKGQYSTRNTGLSPAEIQLSKTLLPEFNRTSSYFPRLYSSGRINKELAASDPDLSPALAFVYNRQNAWRHFESLRDVSLLNHIAEPNIFSSPLSSFCTFSYTPPGDSRTFMGQTAETLNREFITATLNKIPAIPDSSFVLNQLYDYVDLDTVPEDHEGNYTDQSVEPTPLINELALTCTFTLTPTLTNDGYDESTMHVTISNAYELNLEVWYPFTGYTNPNTFSIHIPNPPTETGTLPDTLFGNIRDWAGNHTLPENLTRPRSLPYIYPIQQAAYEIEVPDESEFIALFESLQSTIRFPSIQCVINGDKLVDRVTNLELLLEHTVATLLMPKVTELSDYLFDAKNNGLTTNLVFTAGRSVIDPRLNWEGTNRNQWVKTDDLNNRTSLGKRNQEILNNAVNSPDQTQMLYVRNEGRIDTPYEFTTFLYDIAKPWKTFQFIEEHDSDGTRFFLDPLSPYPHGPPKKGLINPYTPHTNVIASVFMKLPTDLYNPTSNPYLNHHQANEAAILFMEYIANHGWPTQPSAYGTGINYPALQHVMHNTDNPWVAERFFRSTYELFNPRDTLFTLLLAAQKGSDQNADGVLSDHEIQTTQKAVVYIWRDPLTGKSACVFYGLSDTLQSALQGETWGELLQAFKP